MTINEGGDGLIQSPDDEMMTDSVGPAAIANHLKQAALGWPSHLSQPIRRSKPLEPFVSRPLQVESVIQRNQYRRAKAELSLYLLLDQPPEEGKLVFPPLGARVCHDAEDSSLPDSHYYLSDRSTPCNPSLASRLTRPQPISVIQPLKVRWGFLWSRRYADRQ